MHKLYNSNNEGDLNMIHRKGASTFGAVTIGDIRNAIDGHDDDEIVYLDGYSFSACINDEGNLEFRAGSCEPSDKELW